MLTKQKNNSFFINILFKKFHFPLNPYPLPREKRDFILNPTRYLKYGTPRSQFDCGPRLTDRLSIFFFWSEGISIFEWAETATVYKTTKPNQIKLLHSPGLKENILINQC